MSGGAEHSETIISAVVSFFSGGALSKLASILMGRKAQEVSTLGETIRILSDTQDRIERRQQAVEEKLDACESRHEECEVRVGEMQSELKIARAQIDRMLHGRQLPAYHLNAPKGDPGKGEGQ